MSLERVSVLVAGMTTDLAATMRLASLVDTLGYRRIWIAETNAVNAAALGGAIATATSLEIGTALVPVYSRSPALLAMMVGTWSALADGRPVHLGIGAGGQTIVEDWHGLPYASPVHAVGDTIAILRQSLAGERTTHDGPQRRSSGFSLGFGPQPDARIYVGGMGPRMQQLAAQVADGLIVTWLSPRVLTTFSTEFADNVAAAGRDRASLRLVTQAYVAVTDDVAAVREAVRREIVGYVVSPPYARFFSSVGFAEEVAAVHDAFTRGDREGTARAITDRLLDEVLVVGRSGEAVAERLQSFLDAGADDVMVQPVPRVHGGDAFRTVAAVAEAMR